MKEKRIQDYRRIPLKRYGGKLPPFGSETDARTYIKGRWNISNSEEVDRLLPWYLPTLFPCGCPDQWSDKHHGLGLRLQYDCGDFFRCSNCGEERNPDGTHYKRLKRVSDVDDIKEEPKIDKQQLSLLDWKEDNEY